MGQINGKYKEDHKEVLVYHFQGGPLDDDDYDKILTTRHFIAEIERLYENAQVQEAPATSQRSDVIQRVRQEDAEVDLSQEVNRLNEVIDVLHTRSDDFQFVEGVQPTSRQLASFLKTLPQLLEQYKDRTDLNGNFVISAPINSLLFAQRGFNSEGKFSDDREMVALFKDLLLGLKTPESITGDQDNAHQDKRFEVYIAPDHKGVLAIWCSETRRLVCFKAFQATRNDELLFVNCILVDGPRRQHPPTDGLSSRANKTAPKKQRKSREQREHDRWKRDVQRSRSPSPWYHPSLGASSSGAV